jgi:hypothetical protein
MSSSTGGAGRDENESPEESDNRDRRSIQRQKPIFVPNSPTISTGTPSFGRGTSLVEEPRPQCQQRKF